MARRAVLVFAALLALLAIGPARAFLTQEREVIASTPSVPVGAVVPVELPAGSEACLTTVTFTPQSQIARFSATPAAGGGPPLRIVATGGEGTDYRATARVAPGWEGTPATLDVPLRPPAEPTIGSFCVRNEGGEAVALGATEQGRGFSRGDLLVDGQATAGFEVQLTLLAAERASLASRAGQVLDRLATFKPGGGWLAWLLLGLTTVAVPVALGAALRSALRADGLEGVPARTPAAGAPGPWADLWASTRRAAARVPSWAAIGAAVVLAGLFLAQWSVDVKSFQNDEDLYVYLSRWLVGELPASLWDFDVMQRGLQRLEVWLLALTSVLPSPEWLVAARALNALAFASTVVPVWLLGRGLGLGRWWALLPAVASVLVPWSIVATALLTENLAYPLSTWVVWAIWRTAVRPGVGRDAAALGLLLLAGLSRTALLALAPVLPAVVAAHDLRRTPGPARARVAATLRAHPLVWALTLPGVLVLAGAAASVGPLRELVGVYGIPIPPDLALWADKLGQFAARIAVGTGVLPLLVAAPWLVRHAVRHRDDASGAFALTALLATAAIAVTVYPAALDERYVVYLAPLVLVPATVAVVRRELWPAGIALTGVAMAVIMALVPWVGTQGPYGHFASSVEMFVANALGQRLGSYLPGGADAVVLGVAMAVGVAALALAATLRRAPGRLAGTPAVLLVGGALALIAVQTQYTFSKFVAGAGNVGGPSLEERAWIDAAVPEGEEVAAFVAGQGNAPFANAIWQEAHFYNPRLDSVLVFPGAVGINVPIGDGVFPNTAADADTGLLSGPGPIPRHLVTSTLPGGPGLAGEVVAAPDYLPLQLVRRQEGPPSLRHLPTGFDTEGWLPPGEAGSVRFFGRGLEGPAGCAVLALGGATLGTEEVRYEVAREGQVLATGTLAPMETREVPVAVPSLAGRQHLDVAVRARGTHPVDEGTGARAGTVRLLGARVDPRC